MRIKERKLQLIQRCMDINDEAKLRKIEDVVRNVELDRRAQASEEDIRYGKVDDYNRFSDDIKLWMKEKRRSA